MTEKHLPGHDKQPGEIICPSCGRFVGALTRCPHCGARIHKRLSIRVTRVAALILATVGLVLLYLMAVNKELQVIKVGELKPTMNFAAIRVIGTVSSDARVFRQGGNVKSIRFEVDDGTGEIPVAAYQAQAQGLIDQKKIPRMGDEVEVSGSLSISANDRILLRLQGPDQLVLQRTELDITPIGKVSLDDSGEAIMVQAVITDVRPPRAGGGTPWSITLTDDTGEAPLTFWEDTYAEIAEPAALVSGSRVKVRASVGSYRNNLQLRLAHGDDITFLQKGSGKAVVAQPSGTPSRRSQVLMLDEINAAMKDELVETEGVVKTLEIPRDGAKRPYKLTLQEGDATVDVIFWDKVAQEVGADMPQQGERLRVRGKVNEYRGQLQIEVRFADQLNRLEKSEFPEESPADEIAIADVAASMAGQTVVVRGVLGEPRAIRGGTVFPLGDGENSIELVLWNKQVPEGSRAGIEEGAEVTVRGRVKEYRGKLEVVPAGAQDIRVN